MPTAVQSIMESKVSVPIKTLKHYPKNPRIGDVDAIADSLAENGMFQPLVVQKSTSYVLSGNHTLKAAKQLGWSDIEIVPVDVDDQRAAKIVLAANRTSDLASYDTAILQDILSSIPTPGKGTGYTDTAVAALLEGMSQNSAEQVEAVLRPPITQSPLLDTEWGESDNSVGGGKPAAWGEESEVTLSGTGFADAEEDDGGDGLEDELGKLQGVLQLSEDMDFKGNNYYQIPDLARGGLLDKLADKVDTWAGPDATEDDGETQWVWNYGVAAKRGLPMERAILSFYTYDTYFETFWENPAFMTAKMLNAGIKTAMVPDFSYYTDMPVATWVFNQYRAQWLGRYFQEAGIKVIPRIQFAIDKLDSASLDFNTMGIPKNSPVVAKCTQNSNGKEEFDLEVYGLRKSLEKVQPGTLLMYGGNPALRVLEELKPVENGLCDEVVHVYNYAHKRRGVVFDKKEGLATKNKHMKRNAMDAAASPLATTPPKRLEQDMPEPKKAKKRAAEDTPVAGEDAEL